MQIEISSSGTPAHVNASVATQLKAAATPDNWPTLVSVRDYIGAQMAKAGESDSVSITAVIAVEIAIAPVTPSVQPSVGAPVGAPVAEPEEPDGN